MAIFESQVSQTTAVGNSAVAVMDTNSTNGKIPAGTVLKDITFVNEGPNTVYLGGSTVTTATGLQLPAGCQLTIQGFNYTTGTGSGTNTIYAIGAAAGAGTVLFGLASVASVV